MPERLMLPGVVMRLPADDTLDPPVTMVPIDELLLAFINLNESPSTLPPWRTKPSVLQALLPVSTRRTVVPVFIWTLELSPAVVKFWTTSTSLLAGAVMLIRSLPASSATVKPIRLRLVLSVVADPLSKMPANLVALLP